jgi:hypothetical protein
MSSPLSGLRSLFHGRDPQSPEKLHPDFKVELPHEHDEHEADHSSPYIHVDRAGEVFGIEYETPRGSLSRRWITVEGFKQSRSGDWFLYGYCFARKGVKSYALDRVRAIYDHDGEPVALSEIFPEGSANAPDAKALADTPGKEVIASCRDGLCALTALAKIDGTLDPKEVEFILKYAEAAAKKANLNVTAEDTKAIERYIRNVQPTGDVVAESLDRIGETDLATQKEFFWYAREVMDADGLQDEAEIEMILEISEALSHEL